MPSSFDTSNKNRMTRRFACLSLAAALGLNGTERLAAQAPPARPPRRRGDLAVAPITLTSRGFDPPQATLRAGQVLFVVYNQSGTDEIDLDISRRRGGPGDLEPVRAQRLSKDRWRWHDVIDLQPGTYEVVDRNHPEWKAVLTVEAR